MIATLPVLMALSSVPKSASTQPTGGQPAQAPVTITCPLTGEQIPSCCCPVQN